MAFACANFSREQVGVAWLQRGGKVVRQQLSGPWREGQQSKGL